MFDIASSELLLVAIVAVIVIGPKDLPRALYKVGQVLGKARDMTRHFRAGVDEMVRHVEIEEMEKKWAADNARIMAQGDTAISLPVPPPPAEEPVSDAIPASNEGKSGSAA